MEPSKGAKVRYLLMKHYRTDCMLAIALTIKYKEDFLDDVENLLMGPFQFKLTTDVPGYDRVFKYKGTNAFGGVNKVQLFEWLSKKGWTLSCCFGDKFAEEYVFTKGASSSSGGAGGGSSSRAVSRAGTSIGNDEDW
ncbi:uncharacterized protein LOC142358511 [Convolutriloba macropyga]|uniref:uncharacterized protein LOC142358511 n=1 Tax=Convolutriloba macropyga TaxID=536237 RepID=UPI003F51F39C